MATLQARQVDGLVAYRSTGRQSDAEVRVALGRRAVPHSRGHGGPEAGFRACVARTACLGKCDSENAAKLTQNH